MATIKEVADYAEVSVATVSRVVNNSGYVSEELEVRVRNAMVVLNYTPSALARSLRSRRTQVVGVLIPQLDQPFFSALAFSIEQALFSEDYRTLICSSEGNRKKEDAYIDMLLRQRVDGVIFAPMEQSGTNIKQLLKREIPVVIVDRDLPDISGISRVLTDNYHGAYDGMRHLLDLGHRQIGIVSGPRYSQVMTQRIRGAYQAIIDFGLTPNEEFLISGLLSPFEIGYTAVQELLKKSPPPTAIFALTDLMAVGVIHAAAMMGLQLPNDLSLIGFDNIPLASHIVPELTTVAQPIYQIGETAARLLLTQMYDATVPVTNTILKNYLVLRKSSAAYKG